MGVITKGLEKISAAISKATIVEELKRLTPDPSPATVRQIISIICNKPMLAVTPKQKTALSLVEQFALRMGALRFKGFQRIRVAIQLIARVLDPSLINQGAFGICGPAAIAIDTAKTDPAAYVRFAIALAESGSAVIGRNVITPVPSIFSYQLSDNTRDGMPQADWIVLASLRDDPSNLQDNFDKSGYGGVSSSVLFNWMVKWGFRNVTHMTHIHFGNMFECYPKNLLPEGIVIGDKLKTVMSAAELSQRGWRIFMHAYMQLSKSIESFKKIRDLEADSDGPLTAMKNRERGTLNQENPGHIGSVFGGLKSLAGFDGGDGKHWTYVERLFVNRGNNTVIITCCNHGIRYPSVTVPLDGFLNKFIGFVAVTDYA